MNENVELKIRLNRQVPAHTEPGLRRLAQRFANHHEPWSMDPYLRVDVSSETSLRYGEIFRAVAVWGGSSGSVSAVRVAQSPEDAAAEALTVLTERLRSFERSIPVAA